MAEEEENYFESEEETETSKDLSICTKEIRYGKKYLENIVKLDSIAKVTPEPEEYDECVLKSFLNCMTIAFYFASCKNILFKYKNLKKYHNKFNFSIKEMPFKYSGIKKFLENNKKLRKFTINIFSIAYDSRKDLNKFGPRLYFNRSFGKGNNKINLLAIRRSSKNPEEFKETHARFFFFYVKNIKSLCSKRYKNSKLTQKNRIRNCKICSNCFQTFYTENALEKHEKVCTKDEKVLFKTLSNDKITNEPPALEFKQIKALSKMEIIGFLDFESILKKNEKLNCPNCLKENCKCLFSHKWDLQIHSPIIYSLVFIDKRKEIIFEKVYSGEDCIEDLVNTLNKNEKIFLSRLQQYQHTMKMSNSQKIIHHKSDKCYFCKIIFETDKAKLKHHCHYTGNSNNNKINYKKIIIIIIKIIYLLILGVYIGPACYSCNAKHIIQTKIPIFVHVSTDYYYFLINIYLNFL